MSDLVIVPTGTANMASVLAAFRRLSSDPVVASDIATVAGAGRLVVPGVGSFGAAMDAIDRSGLRETVAERIIEGRPTLAVCVGMQLLAASSDESTGATGLGVVPGRVRRFGQEVRVPQMGWNMVEPDPQCRMLTPGWAYFANSYRLDTVPDGWSAALSDHSGSFVAGLERGDVLACQFHPELSGAWGAALLSRWLETTGGR